MAMQYKHRGMNRMIMRREMKSLRLGARSSEKPHTSQSLTWGSPSAAVIGSPGREIFDHQLKLYLQTVSTNLVRRDLGLLGKNVGTQNVWTRQWLGGRISLCVRWPLA